MPIYVDLPMKTDHRKRGSLMEKISLERFHLLFGLRSLKVGTIKN